MTGQWEVAGGAPPAEVLTTPRAPVAIWTGERALVWRPGFVAAFDPGRGTWAATGEIGPPTDAAMGASVVWADGVLFVWGGFPDVGEGVLIRPPDPAPEIECRTEAPFPAPERGEEPAVDPDANRFGSTMADGRPYEILATANGYTETIDGEPGSRAGGTGIISGTGWSNTSWDGPDADAGLGLAVGVRPAGAVRTYVVDDEGRARCDGISFSPDGRWFALPDVAPDWLLVHEDAHGDDVIDEVTGSGPCTIGNDCPHR